MLIGVNTEAYDPAGDNQINIGNLIYGIHGIADASQQIIDYGKIGIKQNNPQAMLDVKGEMFINDLPTLKDGQYPLVVDENGFIGKGLVSGTPTLNTLLRSDELRKIDKNNSTTQTSFNNGNKLQLSFYDSTDPTEIISNTLLGLSTNELTLKEDVVAEISGYMFFQASIYYTKFDTYSKGNSQSLVISLILEVDRKSGSTETITTGTQIWYGGSTGSTIKIIELQPAIVSLATGDKLRWYIKKETGSNHHSIDELPEGTEQAMANIRPLAGSKISKTISIVAFSK